MYKVYARGDTHYKGEATHRVHWSPLEIGVGEECVVILCWEEAEEVLYLYYLPSFLVHIEDTPRLQTPVV